MFDIKLANCLRTGLLIPPKITLASFIVLINSQVFEPKAKPKISQNISQYNIISKNSNVRILEWGVKE